MDQMLLASYIWIWNWIILLSMNDWVDLGSGCTMHHTYFSVLSGFA